VNSFRRRAGRRCREGIPDTQLAAGDYRARLVVSLDVAGDEVQGDWRAFGYKGRGVEPQRLLSVASKFIEDYREGITGGDVLHGEGMLLLSL
jgi:hypothetical protein